MNKRLEDARIVITGAGAAGAATARMLLAAGAADVVCCDRRGVVATGREGLDPFKAQLAEETNPRMLHGTANEALAGADVFIGLSGPGAVSRDGIASMAEHAIVFAMANPTPEIAVEDVEELVAVIGTGRSDYPNQINNVLAFPGIFRGALDVRATTITRRWSWRRRALASVVEPDHLDADYVIPSVFDQRVAPAVATAVALAAEASGVARRPRARVPALAAW